jgi:Putative Ig domain
MTADIVWKTTTLPDAIVGVAYEAGLAVTGNAAAISAASATSGTLPAGIVCNSTDKVRLTGTPTTAGVYTFKISLTDTPDTAVQSGTFTLTVRAAADVCGSGRLFSTLPVAAQLASTWP